MSATAEDAELPAARRPTLGRASRIGRVEARRGCGHSDCGAIQALYTPPNLATPHISRWLDLARAAMLPEAPGQEALRRAQKRSVVLQLERLMGYPMVREAGGVG